MHRRMCNHSLHCIQLSRLVSQKNLFVLSDFSYDFTKDMILKVKLLEIEFPLWWTWYGPRLLHGCFGHDCVVLFGSFGLMPKWAYSIHDLSGVCWCCCCCRCLCTAILARWLKLGTWFLAHLCTSVPSWCTSNI